MNGARRAFLRLFAVQGAWNYERMQGVGMGYAAAPLLEDLRAADPARHAAAVVRSAEFFNGHPYLAGLALGATVRAEYDAAPPEQISRLRRALCSPLGALGDQLFWAGLLPALAGAAVLAICFGAGLWALAGFLVLYNAARVLTARWALETGLARGLEVGRTVAASWVPRAVGRVGPAAGLLTGLAVPIAAGWLLEPYRPAGAGVSLAVAAAGLLLARLVGPSLPALRFGLLVLGLTLLFRLVTA